MEIEHQGHFCSTSNISAYLYSVMAPLVKQLPTYVKDSSQALQILESFSFTGSHWYLFTRDIRSLYTIIPNNDGLQASQPPTSTTSTYVQNSSHQLSHLLDWLTLSLTQTVLILTVVIINRSWCGYGNEDGGQLHVPVCWLLREKNVWRISRKKVILVQTLHRWRPDTLIDNFSMCLGSSYAHITLTNTFRFV